MAKKKPKTCGKCFWIWIAVGKKTGFWMPLTAHECNLGCKPSSPGRDGRHRFEVVSKACRPLKTAAAVAKKGMPDCTEGECEWEAVDNGSGGLKWQLNEDRCSQGCECADPLHPPEFLGETYLDFCIEATSYPTKKKAKKKAAKKKAVKKKTAKARKKATKR